MGDSGFDPMHGQGSNCGVTGFTTHVKDCESGLQYMQARYYDPVLSRFTSVDPVDYLTDGRTGMVNRYSYTINDPVNGWDPDGMDPYLGSRSVQGTPFYHMYVVYNADYVGDPNATVLSWGQGQRAGSDETALVSHSEQAQGRVTGTLQDDIDAWKSMGEGNLGHEVQAINASDETIADIGNRTVGHADYDLFPAISRGGANSNSAAASVANRATQIDNPGAAEQALPSSRIHTDGRGRVRSSPVSLPGSDPQYQERVELSD